MVLLLLASVLASSVQPELVIVTEKTKQYHRAACPLIRDGKDVIAMTRGQAEARGFKAHPACDPANPANASVQPSPDGTSGSDRPRPVYVYTSTGDARYHRESCAKLSTDRKKVLLEEAGKKLWPCSVCRPPIRKRTPAVPRRYGRD